MMSSSCHTITEVASFPPNYFLENIAVRKDGSLLVTVLFHRQLWYIPPFRGKPVEPVLVYTFELMGMGIVEAEPDVFYVSTGVVSRGCLLRFDLRSWSPGQSIEPEVVVDFSRPVGMLNGSCLIAPKVILLADCFAGLIWRVDLSTDGKTATVHEWLQHESMAHDPNGPMPDQPGVNGIRYASKSNYLYYTSTAKKLFMRVRVDPGSLNPEGLPELVGSGMMGDDFCIDEDRGLAYITTHRENTIDCLSLTPSENEGPRQSVVGVPILELMVGPSAVAWGRDTKDYGRVAYVTTDGGIKAPMPDGIRQAKVLRVEL